MDMRAFLNRSLDYVRKHPDELVRAAIQAAGLRFGVPLAALRWLASEAKLGKKAPKDIHIDAAPPAIRLEATVDAMGTPLRAHASIRIEEVGLSPDSLRVALRLRDVKITMLGESDAPVAMLIKSGALDLSKPGNLLKFLPQRPPAIVDAEDDRIILDLMKVPKLAANVKLRKALAVISPLLSIRAIETDHDHLYIALKAKPRGLFAAVHAARS